MTALLLLAPGTPLFFQGQEFAASAPFYYFADHKPELAERVQAGRAEFLAQFRSLADPRMKSVVAPPHDPATFERCKLDLSEREQHSASYQLVKDLLKIRREDVVFRVQRPWEVDGAVFNDQAFVLRYFADDGMDRLFVVNFGRDLHLNSCPEPLLAPPEDSRWRLVLSTEDPQYGGSGTGPIETEEEGWRICGEAAFVFLPETAEGSATTLHHGRLGGGKGRIVY